MTRATVAVCTLNRADVLRGCLASLSNQLFYDDDVEVLVVDNGSTDRTPELLAHWSAGNPQARRSVREPLIGLVNARNAALAASDREVVIFIDDSGSMAFEEQGERIKDLELILQRVAFAATLFDEDGYVGIQRSRQKNVLTMNVASRSAS